MHQEMNHADLLQAATDVRSEFEQKTVEPQHLMNLYSEYNPIGNIHNFIRAALICFPHLNCGIASTYIQSKLNIGKIVNGTYGGVGHTFLLTDDHLIIDITADQFGGPPVYVGPLISPWSLEKK